MLELAKLSEVDTIGGGVDTIAGGVDTIAGRLEVLAKLTGVDAAI